jgi:rhodanese-related sulfurtransferase
MRRLHFNEHYILPYITIYFDHTVKLSFDGYSFIRSARRNDHRADRTGGRMKTKGLAAMLLGAGISVISCGASAEVTSIAPGTFIVDVRTPAEFASAHFPGAVNIPLDQLEKRLSEFGAADRPIIVYCRSGRRSGLAKDLLRRAGYSRVLNGGSLTHMLSLRDQP